MKRGLLKPMSKQIVLMFFCIGVLLTGLAYGTDRLVPGQYTTIQAAIDATVSGDTVIVSPGTYFERITIPSRDIVLKSTNPDDWTVVESTIIDANDLGRVVTFTDNRTSACKLEGLTITGGRIENNDGAGIYGYTGTLATIRRCIIRDNATVTTGRGAGLFWVNGLIEDCKILNNHAAVHGGGISWANGTIRNCLISGNSAGKDGGGINILNGPMINCTIVNNIAGVMGGGFRWASSVSNPPITNCVIWGNSDSSGTVESSQLYKNGATPTVSYCCVEFWTSGGTGGTHNIDCYPYFADWSGGDYHLTWNSPCINRGDPNGSYTGQKDIDGDARVVPDPFIGSRVDIGADEMGRSVLNPGFEDVTVISGRVWPVSWPFEQYTGYKTIDTTTCHSGQNSWKFANNSVESYGASSDIIAVNPQNCLELSAWVKSSTGQEKVFLGITEYDKRENPTYSYLWFPVLSDKPVSTEWTCYKKRFYCTKPNTKYVRVRISRAVSNPNSFVWWDDISLLDLGTEFVAPYGLTNDNDSAGIDLGSSGEVNYGWLIATPSMGGKSSEGEITYRSMPGKSGAMKAILQAKFPVSPALESSLPNVGIDPDSGLPDCPLLLEIMYKDTIAYTPSGDTFSGGVIVRSRIDYLNLDPNLVDLKTEQVRYHPIGHLGGKNDSQWKLFQYAFQLSDFQLIRAIDTDTNGIKEFEIYLDNDNTAALPIDYIGLRKISDAEYEQLTHKQRAFRDFYEVALPADAPQVPITYDNLTVFSRDIMRPIYLHTNPENSEIVGSGGGQKSAVTGFGAWGLTEAVSFGIYSEGGIANLTFVTSALDHESVSGANIPAENIKLYEVLNHETRQSNFPEKGYALAPDRLMPLTALSLDADTSKRVWIKIRVPDKGPQLPYGLYEGTVTIMQGVNPLKVIPIQFYVYDIELDLSTHSNPLWTDAPWKLTNDIDNAYAVLRESGVDPCMSDLIPPIKVSNKGGQIDYDPNAFEEYLDTAIAEGFVKKQLIIGIWQKIPTVYKAIYGPLAQYNDLHVYDNLSDPNFVTAFGNLYALYIQLCADRHIDAVFYLRDEPGSNPALRIETERMWTIANTYDPNAITAITYYPECDQACAPGDYYTPDNYNGTGDNRIPALTGKIDIKIWPLGSEGIGYNRHNRLDPNFPDYPQVGYELGYYTTYHSNMRNPIYNRFLHGLFAFGTDAKIVMSYVMGLGSNDPYNDFDPKEYFIFPFTYPDFLLSYPTWAGDMNVTLAFEGLREGITDARYIATLQKLIDQDPNLVVAAAAQDYLDALKARIKTDYSKYYGIVDNSLIDDLGYYKAILKDVSGTSDPNNFESFTGIRQQLAGYIVALQRVKNTTQGRWYSSAQTAINGALAGDEIIVYPGTYLECLNFGGKAITVRSSDPTNPAIVAATIIDANDLGRVVIFDQAETSASILDGLTIQGGSIAGDGGGIYCYGSSPMIRNCVITGNDAVGTDNDGGGICIDNGGDPIIEDCTITNNTAADKGGGIQCKSSGSQPQIRRCTISGNTAVNSGGGIRIYQAPNL